MRKRKIFMWAGGAVAAAAVALAVALPVVGGGTQASASNVGLDGCDNTAITSLVVAHGNDGEEVSPTSIDTADYEGFMFRLKDDAPASLKDESAIAELGGQITYYEASGLYSATSLQAIDDFVDEKYISYIEPNYTVSVAEVDEEAVEEATEQAAAKADDNSTTTAKDASTEEYSSTPDDPQYTNGNQWNLTQMNVSGSWEKGLYGQRYDKTDASKVTVAVIDSGLVGTGDGESKHEDIDYNHVLEGVNLVDSKNGTPDTHGHGTFVSGLIAAQSNNSKGIAGITPEVDIYPVRVFGSSGKCSDTTIIEGIYDAINADVDVINMSLGGTYASTAEQEACEAAVNAGIIVVAAAGNEETEENSYPAAFDCVIGVSSTDQDETLSYYSNYGENNVYVAAPGANVTSLSNSFGSNGESQYRTASGTSFSCPEVVALGALSKSIFPDYSQDDFKELLKETSRDKGAEGYDKYYGWGIVDFGAAAESLLEKVYVPTYYLSFNTVDQDGAALGDVALQVTAAEDISWEADTDAGIEAGSWKEGTVIEPSEDGTYHLHKGTYQYSVSKDGYTAKVGVFNTYKEQQTENITLEKTYNLTLKIVDTAGDELDGAKAAITRTEGEVIKCSFEQGDDGLYTNDTPSGTYYYTVTVPGYEESTGYFTVDTQDLTEYVTMYASNEVCHVSFDCRSGSEQGDAVSGMSISLEDSNGNSIPTMSDGRYLLTRGARYYYTVTRPGYEDQTGKFTVDDAADQTVTVVMTPAVNLVYVEAADQDGDVLEDAEFELKGSDGNAMSPVKTNNMLYNLKPGTYSYTVNCAGYGVKNGTFTVDSSDSYKYLTIVMKAATGTLKLSATDIDDTPISDATFVIYNDDGAYQMPASDAENTWYLPQGSYHVAAQANGYEVNIAHYDVAVGQTVTDTLVLTKQSEEPTGFSEGDGTANAPYMITTETQLRSIAGNEDLLDKHFVLLNDITLSSDAWTPIGQYISSDSNAMFTGSFDGAGHTVSGLKANVSSGYAGFFGAIKGATIKNLRVEGTVVSTADKSTGGLVGGIYNVTGDDAKNNSTKITNCEFKGTVRGLTRVGGLVGYAYSENGGNDAVNIYISRCVHTGSAKDKVMAGSSVNDLGEIAGGIVGTADAVKITSCYNTVAVVAKTNAGGITGTTGKRSGAYSCYNTGNVTASAGGNAGGITGSLSGTISNCYWLEGTGPYGNAGTSDTNATNSTTGKKSKADLQDSTFVGTLNNCDDTIDEAFVAVENNYPKLLWEVGATPEVSAETPAYTVQPQSASYEVGASDVAPLTVAVNAVSDGGTLSYQWYRNDMRSTRDADAIEDANGELNASNNYSTSYTPSVDEASTSYYYVLVTNSATDTNGVTRRSAVKSDYAQINVTALAAATVPTVSGASIVDAQGQTVSADNYKQNEVTDNQVKVEASVTDNGALSYQWYKSRYATTKGAAIEGATNAACSVDTATAGSFYYYCKVTNTLNGNTATANSARAHVTVNGAITHTITYVLNDGVNSDDNPSSYTEGTAVTLSNPTRDGYEFDGWYTSADFTGEAVTKIPADATTDFTLYAKWSQKTVGPTPTPDPSPDPTPTPTPTPTPDPTPTPSDELTISSAEDLANLAAAVNSGTSYAGKTVTLAADISLSSYGDWTPIGTANAPFAGTFDGNGHSISGLSITSDVNGNVGLFGYITGTVTDLSVAGNIGPITGGSDGSTALDNIGGVVGYNGGMVSDCFSSVTVTIRSANIYAVGGIVGQNGPAATITRCANTGSITGAKCVGGVCGRSYGTISLSYNTGSVTGNSAALGESKHKDSIGGICGQAGNKNSSYSNSITSCYNTGAVSNSSGKWFGGICGFADSATTLQGCYNTGTVAAGVDWEWNPIIGKVDSAYSTVSNNYSLQGLSAGSTGEDTFMSVTVGTVLTTDEFKSAASKLNATATGAFVDGSNGYPQLSWEAGTTPSPTPTPTDLPTAKTAAKAELQTLVDSSGLAGDELATVQKLADEASAAIDAATTADEVAAQLAAGKTAVQQKIDELKLSAAKAAAKEALKKLLENATTLSDSDKAAVQKLIDEYSAKIDAAATTADLQAIQTQATSAVEKAIEKAGQQETDKISITKATIKVSGSKFVYAGKAVQPKVTVVYAGRVLVAGTDYTVEYFHNNGVGTASVFIGGIGSYSDGVSQSFVINPAATKIKKLKAGKKSMKVKWAKQAAESTGYQVRYSLKKNMKKSKTVTVSKTTTTTKSIKKLKSKKKYYVQVRVYKVVDGQKYCSSWSKKKSVKIK